MTEVRLIKEIGAYRVRFWAPIGYMLEKYATATEAQRTAYPDVRESGRTWFFLDKFESEQVALNALEAAVTAPN